MAEDYGLADIIALAEEDPELKRQLLGALGVDPDSMTPSQSAVMTRGSGKNDSLRQLMLLQQMMGQGDAKRGFRYEDPIEQARGLQSLMLGGPGAADPSRYAYGPTKAGPYVFWPTQPPDPRRTQNLATGQMLASGINNAISNYMSQRNERQGGSELEDLMRSLGGGG